MNSFGKIFETYEVPENVGGYLEWVSGILYINASKQQWKEYLNVQAGETRSASQRELCQTVTHETYHFLQIAMTGYLYRFACRLFTGFRSLLSPLLSSSKIEQLLCDPPPLPQNLIELVRALDSPGPEGLTVRDIVESSAYLYEHLMHYPDMNKSFYDEILASSHIGPEYKKAYSMAEDILGPHVMDTFLTASFISLCFEQPAGCFLDVLKAISEAGPEELASGCDFSRIFSITQEVSQRHKPLGPSEEVAAGGMSHPVYTLSLELMNESLGREQAILMLLAPRSMNLYGAVLAVRPALFKDPALWVPENFRQKMPEQDDAKLFIVALLGAFALTLLNKGQDLSRYR